MSETTEKPNKFMDYLQYKLAPAMQKFMQRPWVSGFTDGIIKCLPFILTGCFVFFWNAVRSWLKFLPDISAVQTYTFSMMALLVSFMIVHEEMAKLKHRNYMVVGGLTAICVHILSMHGIIDDAGTYSVNFYNFGPMGILVAMVVGIYVSIMFNLFSKVRFFKKGSDVPTFVQDWVKNVVPIFVTVLIQKILVLDLNVDLFTVVLAIFQPIQNIAQSFGGFLLFNFIEQFFYSLGVSGWTWSGLANAIQVPAQATNLANGYTGVNALLNTSEIDSGIGLINLGGMCATFALNIWFLTSKSKRLKTLGKVCLGPGLFNINEPILYGAPIIYNPILLIPAWICALVGPTCVWFIFRLNLLSMPNVQLPNVGTLPILINTVMLTGDMRGILWWVVMFALYLAIWYPFFKRFEKTVIAQEQQAAATEAADSSESAAA